MAIILHNDGVDRTPIVEIRDRQINFTNPVNGNSGFFVCSTASRAQTLADAIRQLAVEFDT